MIDKQILKVRVTGSNQMGRSWEIACLSVELDGFSFNQCLVVGKTGYKDRSDAEFDANEALFILKLAIDRAWE